MATVDQVVGGHKGCTGLSEVGRRQCELLRDRLARTGELADSAALYASVLPRAVETAQIIAPALASGDTDTVAGLDVVQDCDLCEMHPSDEVDGMKWQEFASTFGPAGPASVYDEWAPGCETVAHLAARVGAALSRLARVHAGETVVVACHGGVVDASFAALGRVPVHRGFSLRPENTGLTEWSRPAGEDEWRLVRYNDAAHLAGLGAAGAAGESG
jgi:probable phosphoglycerate mutase